MPNFATWIAVLTLLSVPPDASAPGTEARDAASASPAIELESIHHISRHAWKLAFSPNGKKLAIAGLGNLAGQESGLSYVDVESGEVEWTLGQRGCDGAHEVAVSPDGSNVIALFKGSRGLVCLDAKTGERIERESAVQKRDIQGLAISPSGPKLITLSDQGLEFWSWPDLELLGEPETAVTQFALSPAGQTLLFVKKHTTSSKETGPSESRIHEIDMSSGARRDVKRVEHHNLDGLAVRGSASEYCWRVRGGIERSSTRHDTERSRLAWPGRIGGSVYDSTGDWLAVASPSLEISERKFTLWNLDEPVESVTFGLGRGLKWAVAFRPVTPADADRGSSTLLATGGEGGVTIWRASRSSAASE